MLTESNVPFFLFLMLIKGMQRQDDSKIFLYNTSGGKLLLRPSANRTVYISAYRRLSRQWLIFVILVVYAALRNECRICGHFHSFREVKCLQSYSKTSKLRIQKVENYLIMCRTWRSGYNREVANRHPRFNSHGQLSITFALIKFALRINIKLNKAKYLEHHNNLMK